MNENQVEAKVLDRGVTFRDLIIAVSAFGGVYIAYKGIKYFWNGRKKQQSCIIIEGNQTVNLLYHRPDEESSTNTIHSSPSIELHAPQNTDGHSNIIQQRLTWRQQISSTNLNCLVSESSTFIREIVTNNFHHVPNMFIVAISGACVVSVASMFHRDPERCVRLIEAFSNWTSNATNFCKLIAPIWLRDGSLKIGVLIYGPEAKYMFLQHLSSDRLLGKLNDIFEVKEDDPDDPDFSVRLEELQWLNISEQDFKLIQSTSQTTLDNFLKVKVDSGEIKLSDDAALQRDAIATFIISKQDDEDTIEHLMRVFRSQFLSQIASLFNYNFRVFNTIKYNFYLEFGLNQQKTWVSIDILVQGENNLNLRQIIESLHEDVEVFIISIGESNSSNINDFGLALRAMELMYVTHNQFVSIKQKFQNSLKRIEATKGKTLLLENSVQIKQAKENQIKQVSVEDLMYIAAATTTINERSFEAYSKSTQHTNGKDYSLANNSGQVSEFPGAREDDQNIDEGIGSSEISGKEVACVEEKLKELFESAEVLGFSAESSYFNDAMVNLAYNPDLNNMLLKNIRGLSDALGGNVVTSLSTRKENFRFV